MGRDIKSLLPVELAEYFVSIGEASYRGDQVFRWLHGGVGAFSEMTNLPESLRERLDGEFYITQGEILEKQVSALDGTVKYLWRLMDGNTIESVVMEYSHGMTICISTQVGCKMACTICASALGGFTRNLTASEMLDQLLYAQIDIGKRISNVVLMGTGEPLDNFDNTLRFINLANHPKGVNIGARHITLSTVGIIENIDKLANCDIQLSLAVSLHGPDDDTRSKLLPINKSTGIEELFSACERYFLSTGRRVSYEYALIQGINDSASHGELLSKRLKKSGSLLNLIHLNDIEGLAYRGSKPENVRIFTDILDKNGIKYTIRRRLGADIDAACGQLRAKRSAYGTMGNN